MAGEKDLQTLLKNIKPEHNLGEYVFCETAGLENINLGYANKNYSLS